MESGLDKTMRFTYHMTSNSHIQDGYVEIISHLFMCSVGQWLGLQGIPDIIIHYQW